MSTDEYVPSEDDVRIEYVLAHQGLEAQLDAGEAYDRWLAAHDARVAREALDGLADEVTHVNWDLDGPAFALRVRRFKNRNYPEETP